MEEQLEQGNDEQTHAAHTCCAAPGVKANGQQAECKQPPANRVGHVLSKTRIELKGQSRARGKEVRDLDVEKKEAEDSRQRVQDRRSTDSKDTVSRRREQASAGNQTGRNDAVSIEQPVQDTRRTARMIIEY